MVFFIIPAQARFRIKSGRRGSHPTVKSSMVLWRRRYELFKWQQISAFGIGRGMPAFPAANNLC